MPTNDKLKAAMSGDPPWIYRDKDGNKRFDSSKMPETNAYEGDRQWMMDWVKQRYRKFRPLADKELKTNNLLYAMMGTPKWANEKAHDMKEDVLNNLRTLKFRQAEIPGDTILDSLGEYSRDGHYVGYPLPPSLTTRAHEVGHASGLQDIEAAKEYTLETLKNDPVFKAQQNSYLRSFPEIYARIFGLRRALGLKPTDVVTPELLKKRREAAGADEGALNTIMTDESLIKLLNDLVKAEPRQSPGSNLA
jgi:hypothetical protein